MAEKTYEEWLDAFRHRKVHISSQRGVLEQREILDLLEALNSGNPEWEGISLEYLPEKFKTAELCLAAVEQDGEALQYVPKKLKTAELCLMAVEQLGWTFEYDRED